ncbi:MAG: hypothetical protein K0R57_4469 [Paenibacillaceae bacterium]|jgi:hypothetical protein|nr:hypothetical protein [Paenibacillaceae bacterium]
MWSVIRWFLSAVELLTVQLYNYSIHYYPRFCMNNLEIGNKGSLLEAKAEPAN